MIISEERLAEMQVRCDDPLVSDGPWTYKDDRNGVIVVSSTYEVCEIFTSDSDADFVAHARTDVPELIAEVRRLREQIARVEAACENTTEDSYEVNGKEWTDGYEAMLGVLRDALRDEDAP